MKFNKWTLGLAAIGVVSLASAARADETMSQLQTALSSTTISGYVDVAATYRPGTSGGFLPPYSFAKGDGFSLNAVDIALDKPLDESPWAAGYHVELMFGPDSVPNVDGLAAGAGIRQAYVTLRTPVGNGIDWKVGVFDTIVGYESSSDPLNPNYTRSYGYSFEPTTHTGILGTYKVNDAITVSAGVADSSNVGFGAPSPINGTSTVESQKTFMGSVVLTAPDSFGFVKGATLTLGAINSVDRQAGLPGGSGSFTSWYAGTTIPTPITALKVGASFDYLDAHSGGEVWTPAVYATYQATDKLSLNLRAEYLNINANTASIPIGTIPVGNAIDTTGEAVTATVQYNLWANVISRVEFRWDHSEHYKPFGGPIAGGAVTPDRGNDFLVALNLIYQF